MTDVVERAKTSLDLQRRGVGYGVAAPYPVQLMVDLVDELEDLRRDMAWHGITPSTLKETTR